MKKLINRRSFVKAIVTAITVITFSPLLAGMKISPVEANHNFDLDLPTNPVSDQLVNFHVLEPNEKYVFGDMDGPGCIKRLWIALRSPRNAGRDETNVPEDFMTRRYQTRKLILRIYFDGATTPNVEAPVGDFFGVMHGLDYYDVNTEYISVMDKNGYECYFDMPFSKSARIEITNAPDAKNLVAVQVSWDRYPGQEMKEKKRFCAQWRREMPADAYGSYLLLDADGPGQLVGFFYGLRLLDTSVRWSHGGAENIYIDGLGDQPAYIRGAGGEDTFGTSYGGVQHKPDTHLHSEMPYYTTEDTGAPQSSQRLVGYRFYDRYPLHFKNSVQFRFGSMANDICSTVYWYQEGTPRRYVKMPDWKKLEPGVDLRPSEMDLTLPDDGSWAIGPLLDNKNDEAIIQALNAETGKMKIDLQGWTKQATYHGFVDFNRSYRIHDSGNTSTYSGKAVSAVTMLEVPADMKIRIRIAWDDHLVLKVNDEQAIDFGSNKYFRQRTEEVQLRKGKNRISVTQSNDRGYNFGGWAFAFKATTLKGVTIVPRFEAEK
ncbi:MAG: DUF2961 domain-containing protein [Paludibacter sp.]